MLSMFELQMLPLSNAFYRGLTDLISPSWLKLFNASEFNQVCFLFNVQLVNYCPVNNLTVVKFCILFLDSIH